MLTSFELSQLPQMQPAHDHGLFQPFDSEYDFLDSALLQSDDDANARKQRDEEGRWEESLTSFFLPMDTVGNELDSDDSTMSRDSISPDFDDLNEFEYDNSRSDSLEQELDPLEAINQHINDLINEPPSGNGASAHSLQATRAPNHKPDRKYACHICRKRFKRPSSLSTHMNIHTGKKPYPCPSPNCGKLFNAKSNMLRHFKLHFKLSPGVYLLPNGEVTTKKPSSRELLLYIEHYSAIKCQTEEEPL